MCANWNILSSMENSDFDPFQIFEVDHDSCQLLHVTVLHGDNITMGRTRDMLDTPDPYVVLSVPGTNGGSQRTPAVDNCTNPVWHQQFEFLYDAELNKILEISLVDANIVVDYVIGVTKVNISELKLDEETQIRVKFGEESIVHLRLQRTSNESSDLRYSLALCDEEKQFRRERRKRCMDAMNACFGDEAKLTSPMKAPVVAMLGSGGGFRAMIAFCGVFKALKDSGIIEMCMYIAGLSGSTWFVSQLYTHPSFPDIPTDEVLDYFRQRTGAGLFSHLGAQTLMRYMNSLVGKSVMGQPISFTDFFGMLLRDTIVDDKEATLTSMRRALRDGGAPLPLFSSLHVKKNVSAKVFQEWVEFTPFEVGIPKYGTFMDASKFGSRYFKGKISKLFPEYPLHFLQGIWGSAFTILIKRLVEKNGDDQQKSLGKDAEIQNLRDLEENVDDEDIEADECDGAPEDLRCHAEESHSQKTSTSAKKTNEFWSKEKEQRDQALKQKKLTVWQEMMQRMMGSSLLNSRAGRAGAIFNPLYGLRLLQRHPISPFTGPEEEDDETDFARINEMMDTASERLLLVDAGLTFNSPYPVLLRPQRGVDLYISFDFSGREEDEKDMFEELLLAETWACKNKVPFPNIREQARQFEAEPLREVYIFRGDNCPTIMHFVLVNTSFRKFKAPGVPRETEEELEFGDFSLFTGGQVAFGTLNFCYSTKDFDRLSQLTEYNTRINLELIKAEILHAIRVKQLTNKMSLKDVVKMKITSGKSKDDFISLVRQMQLGNDSSTSVQNSQAPSGILPPQLERFASALELLPDAADGEESAGPPRPHRPAERFVSAAEDMADIGPPRPHRPAERFVSAAEDMADIGPPRPHRPAERFVSAAEDMADIGPPRPHRPAERFVSAAGDMADIGPPRPGTGTSR